MEGQAGVEVDEDEDEGAGGAGLMEAMWAGLVHFLWNAPQAKPKTVAGRLVLLGMCVHTLVITSSYTASLAASLAAPDPIPLEVVSFRDVEASRSPVVGKLCVLESNQGLFSGLKAEQIVAMDTYGPMYEKLFMGGCGSLVTGKIDYLIFVQAEQASFSICANASDPKGFTTCVGGGPTRIINLNECKCPGNSSQDPLQCPNFPRGLPYAEFPLALTNTPARLSKDCSNYHRYRNILPADQDGFDAWYNWALPVRDEYAEVISYAILESRLNGDLMNARQDQLGSQLAVKYNVDPSQSTSGVDDPLAVKSLVGLYIYTASLFALAILVHGLASLLSWLATHAARATSACDYDEAACTASSSSTEPTELLKPPATYPNAAAGCPHSASPRKAPAPNVRPVGATAPPLACDASDLVVHAVADDSGGMGKTAGGGSDDAGGVEELEALRAVLMHLLHNYRLVPLSDDSPADNLASCPPPPPSPPPSLVSHQLHSGRPSWSSARGTRGGAAAAAAGSRAPSSTTPSSSTAGSPVARQPPVVLEASLVWLKPPPPPASFSAPELPLPDHRQQGPVLQMMLLQQQQLRLQLQQQEQQMQLLQQQQEHQPAAASANQGWLPFPSPRTPDQAWGGGPSSPPSSPRLSNLIGQC